MFSLENRRSFRPRTELRICYRDSRRRSEISLGAIPAPPNRRPPRAARAALSAAGDENLSRRRGAVRDRLLGLEPATAITSWSAKKPRRRCARPSTRRVGRDFPVFLHPHSGEEYALARTERKSGRGYRGCRRRQRSVGDPGPDLARRDFTINAIAEDGDGVLIDPFGGVATSRRACCATSARRSSRIRCGCARGGGFMAISLRSGFQTRTRDRGPDREIRLLENSTVGAGSASGRSCRAPWLRRGRRSCAPSRGRCAARGVAGSRCACTACRNAPITIRKSIPACTSNWSAICRRTCCRGRRDRLRRADPRSGQGADAGSRAARHIGHEHAGLAPLHGLCERLKVPDGLSRVGDHGCREHLNVHRLFELRDDTVHDLWRVATASASRNGSRAGHGLRSGQTRPRCRRKPTIDKARNCSACTPRRWRSAAANSRPRASQAPPSARRYARRGLPRSTERA